MVSTWSWISKRREESILSMELEHLNHILEASKAMIGLVQAFRRKSQGDVEELYTQIKEEERNADKVKDHIIEQLSTGTFHPIDREELLRVVLVADDIAAYLKSAGRRILLLCRLECEIPANLLDPLEKIAELVRESVETIIEAVKLVRNDPKKTIQLAKIVEKMEEEADDIRSATEERLLEWCNIKAAPGTCTALYNSLTSLEMSTDKCEDTADLLRSIAILSI
ncbi:MAG: DUF47 family protein [Desulfurococcales archaeon]|nr:DUF47 family protein [Desulfurococcales archaeon]